MSIIKKVTISRLESLVRYQEKVCALLERLYEDAYESDVVIGRNRYRAFMIVRDHLKEAADNKKYFSSLLNNFKEEMEATNETK